MTHHPLHDTLEAAADRHGAARPDDPERALAAVHARARRRRTLVTATTGAIAAMVVVALVTAFVGGRDGGGTVEIVAPPVDAATTTLVPGPTAAAWRAGTWSAASAPPAPFSREALAFPVDGKLVVLQPGGWRLPDHDVGDGASAGATHDPAADTWTPIPASPDELTPGSWAVPVDGRLIVWGRDGRLPVTDGTPAMNAASFAPATNTWTPLATPPASIVTTSAAAWTGDRLIVVGTVRDGGDSKLQAVSYDPAADTWHVDATFDSADLAGGMPVDAIWTGVEVIVWVDHVPSADGLGWQRIAAYAPETDSWRALPVASDRPAMSALAVDHGQIIGVTRSMPCGMCIPGTDVVAAITLDPVDGTWSLGPRLGGAGIAVDDSARLLDGASVMAGDAIVGLWPSVEHGEATLGLLGAGRDAWSTVPVPSGTMSVGPDTGPFPMTRLVWLDDRLLVWSPPACPDTADCRTGMQVSVFTPG